MERRLFAAIGSALLAAAGMMTTPNRAAAQPPEIAWSPPTAVNAHATTDTLVYVNDTQPRLAAGAGNVAGVLWRRTPLDSAVLYRSVTNGGTLGPVQALMPGTCLDAQIGANNSGTWIAAAKSQADSRVFVVRSTDNGVSWSAPTSVSTAYYERIGELSAERPHVAISQPEGGPVCLLSVGCVAGGYDILAQTSSDNGATWTTESPVNGNAATDYSVTYGGIPAPPACWGSTTCWENAEDPSVALEASGAGIAVWKATHHSLYRDCSEAYELTVTSRVCAASTLDGGLSWTTVTLCNSHDNSTDPFVAANGTGDWMVVWSRDSVIRCALLGDLGATRIDGASPGAGVRPRVQACADGSWYCTWTNGASLMRSRSTDNGQTWSTPLALDNAANGQILNVGTAAYAIHANATEVDQDVWMRTSADGGATFGPPAPVNENADSDASAANIDDILPSSASDGHGTAVVAWQTIEDWLQGGSVVRKYSRYAAITHDNGQSWAQWRLAEIPNQLSQWELRADTLQYNPYLDRYLQVEKDKAYWIDTAAPGQRIPVTVPRYDCPRLHFTHFAFGANGLMLAESTFPIYGCNDRYCVWIGRSQDNGQSWQHVSTPFYPASASGCGIVNAGNDTWAAIGLIPTDYQTALPKVATSTDNGLTWNPPLTLTNANCDDAALAAGTDGAMAAAWLTTTGEIWTGRSSDRGATWAAPQRLPLSGTFYTPLKSVRLADDRQGTLLLTAYTCTVQGDWEAWSAWSSDFGATWSAPFHSPSLGGPQILVNRGRVLAAWSATDCSSDTGCDNDMLASTAQLPLPGWPADIETMLVDSADPVPYEGEFSYRLTVHNAGDVAAEDVGATCTLPAGLELLGVTASQGTVSQNNGQIAFATDVLRADESLTATIHVRGTIAGTATVTVEAASARPDPNPANNTSVQTTVIGPEPQADLEATLSDSVDPVPHGDEYSYQLTVRNAGTAPAQNVEGTCTIPAELQLLGATTSMGTVSQEGGLIVMRTNGLGVGESLVATINVRAMTVGTAQVSTQAAYAGNDPNPANNTSVETTVIEALPANRANLGGTVQSARLVTRTRRGVVTRTIRGSVRVDNSGPVASAATTAAFYLSADAVLDAGDTQIGVQSVRSVPAGRRITVSVNQPAGAGPDHGYLFAVLDPGNTVPESDETNNICAGAY